MVQKRAFQQLSARLLLSREGLFPSPKGSRALHACAPTLLITSAEPGAGKSTIAANLAMSLAGAGRRVVLLDMDFYHPSVHAMLKLPNASGVSDYACGKITLETALRNSVYPNLTVGTAGVSLNEISESPAPAWIRDLLATVSTASCPEYDESGRPVAQREVAHHEVGYDLIVIDAPALLAVADAAVIASQADAVLLVVAQHETQRKHLRLALQQLAELKVRVAGIVVNKTPHSHLYGYYSKRERQADGAAEGGAAAPSGSRAVARPRVHGS